MDHKIIRYENQMTVAMDVDGNFYQQAGATTTWNKLADPPFEFDNFDLGIAGIVATGQGNDKPTYILPRDPRTSQFQSQWQQLNLPYCTEMASNGMVCACIGNDKKVYTAAFDIQRPTQISTAREIPNPCRLAINAYGLYANTNGQTYMAPNGSSTGIYSMWVPCQT